MTRAVHIVALSARPPVGLSAEGTAAAIRARISRVQCHPFIVDAAGEPVRCAFDSALDPLLLGHARIEALAAAALSELLGKLAYAGVSCHGCEVFLALPEARPGFAQPTSAAIANDLSGRRDLAGLSLQAHGSGHAGCLEALGRAVHTLAEGRAELTLASSSL